METQFLSKKPVNADLKCNLTDLTHCDTSYVTCRIC